MPLRIGVVEIDVVDLDAAWQFFVETLEIPGRSIGHEGEVGAWGVGRGKPFELDLGEGHRVLVYRGSVPTPNVYPNGTGVKLAFFTDDIVGTIAAWRAKGVEFIPIEWSPDASGIASSPFGPFIAFRDPFGNVHELLQPDSPSGAGAWRHTGLSAASGAPNAAGEPVVEITGDGTLHVIYRGFDGHIHDIRSTDGPAASASGDGHP
jgi:hypothetical protein